MERYDLKDAMALTQGDPLGRKERKHSELVDLEVEDIPRI